MAPKIIKKDQSLQISCGIFIDNPNKSGLNIKILHSFDGTNTIYLKIVTNKDKDNPSFPERYDRELHYYNALSYNLKDYAIILECLKLLNKEFEKSTDGDQGDFMIEETNSNNKITLTKEGSLLEIKVAKLIKPFDSKNHKINANLLKGLLQTESIVNDYLSKIEKIDKKLSKPQK